MKTLLHSRLARFAGLSVLSLLVLATGVQAAQAAGGPTRGGARYALATPTAQLQGLTPARVAQHQGATTTAPVVTAAAGAPARGGARYPLSATTAGTRLAAAGTPARGGARFPLSSITVGTRVAAAGTQPAASSTSSKAAWIVGGSAVAVLLIGLAAWATMRRRRQSGEFSLAAFCAQHPEDPQCTAA